jgi:hypothetical protein
MRVFGIAGHSGMGMTTLLERVLPELQVRGLTVQGSFGKVHWLVGFIATWLFRLTSMGPDRLSRFIARRITT